MNTRSPAVVMAPPRLGRPALMPFFSSSSKLPSGTRHAMLPVFVFTAISSPHGVGAQEYCVFGSQKRPPSGVTLRIGLATARRAAAGPPGRPRRVRRGRHRAPGWSPPSGAPSDLLEVSPLPRVHHVGDHEVVLLVVGHAAPVAAANGARETRRRPCPSSRGCTAPNPRGRTSPTGPGSTRCARARCSSAAPTA